MSKGPQGEPRPDQRTVASSSLKAVINVGFLAPCKGCCIQAAFGGSSADFTHVTLRGTLVRVSLSCARVGGRLGTQVSIKLCSNTSRSRVPWMEGFVQAVGCFPRACLSTGLVAEWLGFSLFPGLSRASAVIPCLRGEMPGSCLEKIWGVG